MGGVGAGVMSIGRVVSCWRCSRRGEMGAPGSGGEEVSG